MKTVLFKRLIIAAAIQLLLAASICGQKYESGTRLLKGAEVLSATPLQLDYVLEKLADTVKIDVNIHEGKTHLVLDDGSGAWREWWYYMGRWQVKTKDGALPTGKDGSIQTKSGKIFAGTTLGINEGFIRSLDDTPGDVGINNKNATIRVTPQSTAVMEATKTGANGNIISYVTVAGNEAEQNVTWISQDPRHGSRLRMDTTILEHAQISNVFDFWNFKSSLPDTTFYVKKRIRFDQPKTTVYAKVGDLRLSDKTGDFALSDLVNVSETDPTVPGHVKSITTTNITNWNTAYTNSHAHGNKTVLDGITSANVTNWTNAFNWGNHATQGYLKNESDPVWTAASTNYFTKTNLQTSGGASVHWDNVTNKPTTASGYGITDVYTKVESRTLVGDTANVLRQLIKNSSGSNGLVTSNSSSIVFSGNGTTASPLTAATTNIAGNTNAVLVRDANGKPAASAYVTLNGKTLASPADFTVQAASDITVQSGNVPVNSRLWLSTSTGQSLLESNTSAYSQALSIQPNNITLQVGDKAANSSFLLMSSTLAALQTSSEIRLMRTIQSDRRRTGIQITSGTTDIEGIWIQDGLENPPADNVLSGAYVRANKNIGLKLGFQGNTNAGDPSAYINITKAGSIQLSDISGTIDIKYITQLAKGIKSTILVSMASSTITVDLSPVVPGNVYIVNYPLNGAKTIALANTTIPANSLKEFEIWIPQGTTMQPVTWFSGITWPSGIPTMIAGKTNVFTFRTVDGVNFIGNLAYVF